MLFLAAMLLLVNTTDEALEHTRSRMVECTFAAMVRIDDGSEDASTVADAAIGACLTDNQAVDKALRESLIAGGLNPFDPAIMEMIRKSDETWRRTIIGGVMQLRAQRREQKR